MKPSKLLLLIIIFLFTVQAFAQPASDIDFQIQEIIENLVEDTEEEFEYDELLVQFNYLQQNPLNLNRSTREDLEALYPIITKQQINALVNHRIKFGSFLNIYELQSVQGLQLEDIYNIISFVKVKGGIDDFNVPLTEQLTKGDYSLILRYQTVLEEQEGYTTPDTSSTGKLSTRYLGSSDKVYARFRYQYGNRVSYGITGEKDAGETFFNGSNNKGFDFYSAHAYVRELGPIKALAVGDYSVNFGQGLVAWSGFGFGKSSFVMNVRKSSKAIRPYASVNEYNFFRGGAATAGFGNLSITAFGSSKKVDGNVTQLDTINDEVQAFSSIQEGGLHRTQAEVDDEKRINQLNGGGQIAYKTDRFNVGVSAMYSKFDASQNRRLQPYNQFDFDSSQLLTVGIDYGFQYSNLNFFGETAMSDNGSMATINGLLLALDKDVDMSLVYRNYSKGFQSLQGDAFAESSRPVNEEGIYVGLSARPFRYVRFDGYFDIYKHPWLKFQTDAPSVGRDYTAKITYRPSRSIEVFTYFKNEKEAKNATDENAVVDYLTETSLTKWRTNLSLKVNKELTLRTRLDLTWFEEDLNKESGYLIYQDIIYRPWESPIALTTRFAVFDTDGYNSRLYAYENDILGSFSIPAYYNKGSRFYINAKYRATRNIDVWLRFSQTYWANQKTFGSGLDEIDGNVKSEVKAQVRFKF